MTNPISQAAVDAAKQVLLNEGCLDQEHYPGYRDAVVTAALEAAMPELLARIEQLQAVVRDSHDECTYQTRLAAVEKIADAIEEHDAPFEASPTAQWIRKAARGE